MLTFCFICSSRFNFPESNLPGSKVTPPTRSVPGSCPRRSARGGRGRAARGLWQTSRPAPSKPAPNGRLLLRPLPRGRGRPVSGCGLLLGYRIAAANEEAESTQDQSSPEEEEEEEMEEEEEEEPMGVKSRTFLRSLIRLEHNYSFPM